MESLYSQNESKACLPGQPHPTPLGWIRDLTTSKPVSLKIRCCGFLHSFLNVYTLSIMWQMQSALAIEMCFRHLVEGLSALLDVFLKNYQKYVLLYYYIFKKGLILFRTTIFKSYVSLYSKNKPKAYLCGQPLTIDDVYDFFCRG